MHAPLELVKGGASSINGREPSNGSEGWEAARAAKAPVGAHRGTHTQVRELMPAIPLADDNRRAKRELLNSPKAVRNRVAQVRCEILTV